MKKTHTKLSLIIVNFLLLFQSINAIATNDEQQHICELIEENHNLACKNARNFAIVKKAIEKAQSQSHNIERVYIEGSTLGSITNGGFQRLNVSSLIIENTNIGNISSLAFSAARVKSIFTNNSVIMALQSDAVFAPLADSLEELDVFNGNLFRIIRIFLKAVNKLQVLKKLDLCANHLQTHMFDADSFEVHLPKKFSKIQNENHQEIFNNQKHLLKLNVYSNLDIGFQNVHYVDLLDFYALPKSLEILRLNHNMLDSDIFWMLEHLENLQELHLDHNKIKDINGQKLIAFKKLKTLSLAHNDIHILPGKMFFTLAALRSVVISNQKTTPVHVVKHAFDREVDASFDFVDLSNNHLDLLNHSFCNTIKDKKLRIDELRLEGNKLASDNDFRIISSLNSSALNPTRLHLTIGTCECRYQSLITMFDVVATCKYNGQDRQIERYVTETNCVKTTIAATTTTISTEAPSTATTSTTDALPTTNAIEKPVEFDPSLYDYFITINDCAFKRDHEVVCERLKITDNMKANLRYLGRSYSRSSTNLVIKNSTMSISLDVIDFRSVTIQNSEIKSFSYAGPVRNLEELILTGNKFSNIDEKMFMPAANRLKILEITKTDLFGKRLERLLKAISKLQVLEKLSLAHNGLDNHHMVQFYRNSFPNSIKILRLGDNKLTAEFLRKLAHLEQLEDVCLDNNKIGSLKQATLAPFKRLEKMSMRRHSVLKIESNAFSDSPSLKVLNFSDTKMLQIENYAFDRKANSSQYDAIDFARSRITHVSTCPFCVSPNVQISRLNLEQSIFQPRDLLKLKNEHNNYKPVIQLSVKCVDCNLAILHSEFTLEGKCQSGRNMTIYEYLENTCSVAKSKKLCYANGMEWDFAKERCSLSSSTTTTVPEVVKTDMKIETTTVEIKKSDQQPTIPTTTTHVQTTIVESTSVMVTQPPIPTTHVQTAAKAVVVTTAEEVVMITQPSIQTSMHVQPIKVETTTNELIIMTQPPIPSTAHVQTTTIDPTKEVAATTHVQTTTSTATIPATTETIPTTTKKTTTKKTGKTVQYASSKYKKNTSSTKYSYSSNTLIFLTFYLFVFFS